MAYEFLRKILCFVYSRNILNLCSQLASDACEACQIDSESQHQHDCVMWSDYFKYALYFDCALAKIDHDYIQKRWEEHAISLGASTADIVNFKQYFNWNWWLDRDVNSHMFEQIMEITEMLSVIH